MHIHGSSHSIHALPTLWAEPLHDTEHLQNALLLTTPEDSLTLHTTLHQFKIEWLQELQNAIKMSIRRMNALPLQPPALRNASYVFQKHPLYKDAKYIGRWCNGKMHGTGKLEWPDGKIYFGNFHNNYLTGYGRIDIPHVGIYDGQIKENLQNGNGVMKYCTGDIYEGQFKDGLPHGHGVLKHGYFMSNAASIYIGKIIKLRP